MASEEAAPPASLLDRLREVWADAAVQGRALPAEPTLAATLGASRPSVREALVRLEAEGLIRRRQGADTVVNVAALDLNGRFDQQEEFVDVLRRAGFEATVEVLEWGWVRLEAVTAKQLGVGEGTPGLRTLKRWLGNGRPAMLAEDLLAVPEASMAAPPAVDPLEPLFPQAERLIGTVVEWELAWPRAALAGHDASRWLRCEPTDPVLVLDLIGVTRTGRRAYRATEWHVPGFVTSGFIRTVKT